MQASGRDFPVLIHKVLPVSRAKLIASCRQPFQVRSPQAALWLSRVHRTRATDGNDPAHIAPQAAEGRRKLYPASPDATVSSWLQMNILSVGSGSAAMGAV